MEKFDRKQIKENIKKVTSLSKDKLSVAASNFALNSIEAASNVGDLVQTTTANVKTKMKKHDVVDEINNEEENIEDEEVENDEVEKDKKISLDDMLKTSIDKYNQSYTILNDNGMSLYIERERSLDLIQNIEYLVNSIANHPKSFDADINQIKMYRLEFQNACDFTRKNLAAAQKSAVSVSSGVATGAAVASIAPTAALWIATTFGTASTGTAISTLSGAAATNAALAWLGGGALTVGGGGMATGSAFLALAGPVGWGIAGATLLASVVLFTSKKVKTNKERKEEIEKVKINIEAVQEIATKIGAILDKTSALREKIGKQYNECLTSYEKTFEDISEEHQMRLGVLVNNTKSLAATLSENL